MIRCLNILGQQTRRDMCYAGKSYCASTGREKEKIFTAELFGVEWKIMIDNYNPEKKYFSDLKTMESLYKKFWGYYWKYIEAKYMTFIEHYGYDLQMIIYAEIEKIAYGADDRNILTPYLAVITKEDPPDTMVINGFLKYREEILDYVKSNITRIKAISFNGLFSLSSILVSGIISA